jgi:hypothetical protein
MPATERPGGSICTQPTETNANIDNTVVAIPKFGTFGPAPVQYLFRLQLDTAARVPTRGQPKSGTPTRRHVA